MSGGVRNVKCRNCTFLGTDVGLRFKSTRGRGGVVENIYINNINHGQHSAEPCYLILYYGGNSPVPTLKKKHKQRQAGRDDSSRPEETPSFKNIHITISRAREQVALFFFKAYQK